MSIDHKLLESYMTGFYGYGNESALYWFIGLEEGGGDSLDEIKRRVNVWSEMGGKSIYDLYEYHQKIGIEKWFDDQDNILQPTWSRYCKIILASTNDHDPTRDEVWDYQSQYFGRKEGKELLAELRPLPSPKKNFWIYNTLNIPYLKSRESYEKYITPLRINFLRTLFMDKKPKMVLFNSKSQNSLNAWKQIFDISYKQDDEFDYLLGKDGETYFFITNNMTSGQVTNQELYKMGKIIK